MKTQIFKQVAVILTLCLGWVSCGSKTVAESKAERARSIAELKAEEQEKEYKEKMKEFKKKKFKISGSSRSLQIALLTHYEKLNSDKYEEIVVSSEGCPTINLCDRKSLADAQSKYAALANAFVKGKVTSEGGYNAAGNTDDEKAALDRFYAAYAQYVSANISGRIKRGFAVVRKQKNGSGYEYEAYYLVEKDQARLARLAALKKAQKETEQNIKWGQSIEDWVNDTPSQQ